MTEENLSSNTVNQEPISAENLNEGARQYIEDIKASLNGEYISEKEIYQYLIELRERMQKNGELPDPVIERALEIVGPSSWDQETVDSEFASIVANQESDNGRRDEIEAEIRELEGQKDSATPEERDELEKKIRLCEYELGHLEDLPGYNPSKELEPYDKSKKEIDTIKKPSKELVHVPRPESEDLPELSLVAGAVKDVLAHVAKEARERLEAEKAEMAASTEGLGRFRRTLRRIRMIPRSLKFSTAFKQETERKRGQEVLERLVEMEKQKQVDSFSFSIGEYLGLVKEAGIQLDLDLEKAFVETLADSTTHRVGDVAINGEGEGESPVIAGFRASLKERTLKYVEDSNGKTDDEISELIAEYHYDIQESIKKILEENPEFDKEAFDVMADNIYELAENARAHLKHEDGRVKLEQQLDSMKISIGQLNIGANSGYNTEYLDKTTELMRRRRVGSVVGKASFIASTWIMGGALASGLSAQAAQSASTAAARGGAGMIGGALMGPPGALLGFGVGVGASALWNRWLGRKRMAETIDFIKVSSGESGGNPNVTDLQKNLSLDTLSMTETISGLGAYTEIDESSGEASLKSGLSSSDIVVIAKAIADVRVRLNLEAKMLNDVESGKIQKNEVDNLFESMNSESNQDERTKMIKLVNLLEKLVRERLGDDKIAIEGRDDKLSFDEMLKLSGESVITQIKANIEEIEDKRRTSIDKAGRRAALIGGGLSGAFGLGSAGVTELITWGNARTIFDNLGFRGDTVASSATTGGNTGGNTITSAPQSVSRGGNIEVKFDDIGQSDVDVSAAKNTITITKPDGSQYVVHTSNKGVVSPAEIASMQSEGIDITQNPDSSTHTVKVGIGDYLKDHGGKKGGVEDWYDNRTPAFDGTELGANISKGANGDIILGQDLGVATNPEGHAIDIAQATKDGKLFIFLTHDGIVTKIPQPLEMHNGVVELSLPKGSPLSELFKTNQNGEIIYQGDMWHVGVDRGGGNFDSISTVIGEGKKSIGVEESVYSNEIDVRFPSEPTETPEPTPSGQSTGFTIPGVVPAGDHGNLRSRKKQESAPIDGDGPEPPEKPPVKPNPPTPPVKPPSPPDGPQPPESAPIDRDGPEPPEKPPVKPNPPTPPVKPPSPPDGPQPPESAPTDGDGPERKLNPGDIVKEIEDLQEDQKYDLTDAHGSVLTYEYKGFNSDGKHVFTRIDDDGNEKSFEYSEDALSSKLKYDGIAVASKS